MVGVASRNSRGNVMEAVKISSLTLILRRLEHWVSFTDGERNALLSLPHTFRSIEPHCYMVREGDRADRACLLLSGFAHRNKIVGNGARQILALHMAGDLVDLQNSLLKIADHNVQALTRCEVAYIPREAILRIASEHPAVGEAMWLDTLIDGSISREWIANIGRRDARSRIAHLLCEFGIRLRMAGVGEHTGYELPMTQEQIGDCTGLTPVHVNRTLQALARDGLIRRTNRAVTIGDWNALAVTADFRSGYLHIGSDQHLMN
jgi:CRP-like cAMP-binding protein